MSDVSALAAPAAPAPAPPPGPPYEVVSWRHGRLFVMRNDAIIGRYLREWGEFCENQIGFLTALLRPGDAVVDVGSNIGTLTVPFARSVGPRGAVMALEPQRATFQCLCANVVLAGLTNVHTWRMAAGERTETISLGQIDPRMPGNYGAMGLEVAGRMEQVPMVRLDHLNLTRCDLLKIDVEGLDSAVLRGAAATLARCRPMVYVEAHPGSENTREAIRILQAAGYRLYWHFAVYIADRPFRGELPPGGRGRGDVNVIAIPPERPVTVRLPEIAGPDADWRADFRAFGTSPSRAGGPPGR